MICLDVTPSACACVGAGWGRACDVCRVRVTVSSSLLQTGNKAFLKTSRNTTRLAQGESALRVWKGERGCGSQ